MKLDKLLEIVYHTIVNWLDNKPTGSLSLEIHARKGGISKVFRGGKEEIVDEVNNDQ